MAIYNENGVPILADVGGRHGLCSTSLDEVEGKHDSAVRALEAGAEDAADHLYTSESVVLDNADPARPDYTPFSIGGSTLDEALKEVIGAYDLHHVGDPGVSSDHIFAPRWVSSTNEDLAQFLAEYYRCEAIPLSEVVV